MANILLRSPYFETVTTGSHLSAKLELTIDGTLRYTIIKNATSNRTVFEIASLAKDYYNVDVSLLDTVAISGTWYAYDAIDGGGTQLATSSFTHTGYFGYSLFTDGANTAINNTNAELTNTGGSQIIYLPDNTAGYAYDMNSGTATLATISTSATSVAAASGNYTWTIERICNPTYTPIEVNFINKNGVPQNHYFFLKSTKNLRTKADNYKKNIFDYSSSNYNRKHHQNAVFNKNGNIRYTLNTDYMIEAYNDVMQDLLLSEYVWIDYDGISSQPVVVTSSSFKYKTSVNDRLIQYTIEVEQANQIINNIL